MKKNHFSDNGTFAWQSVSLGSDPIVFPAAPPLLVSQRRGTIDAGLPSESLHNVRNPRDNQTEEFPIVGIGASAGGLAAFEQLFTNIPPNSGMAFVVVQHLSPPHKSILPEILQRYNSMPVSQVTDGVEVKPNGVYVIPPGSDLALQGDACN